MPMRLGAHQHLPDTLGALPDTTADLGWIMQRRRFHWALATCCFAFGAFAQDPGPFATSSEKLDHLLSTWRGQPVARVREVFGREDSTEMRGTSVVLVYEKRVKLRAAAGGFTVHPNGGALCLVRFLISDTEEVSRVARQGGDECWDAWRDYKP